MAISDKLMDIKALVEKHLDQDEIDELYELTEDIEILEQAKDVELQRLRALAEPSSVPANELSSHVSVSLPLTFEHCLREEFLINTQNYPKEYHNIFNQKFSRARKRFEEQ